MKVSINILPRNMHSQLTCKAMAKGIARCGDKVVVRSHQENVMAGFDACVLWGFVETCQRIIINCENLGIPWIFLDMGYWRREQGYFKVAVNDRHPTEYLMDQNLPSDRFDALNLPIKDWKFNNSGNILVAGMSSKAAWSWGLKNEQYEKEVIKELRTRYPDLPITYRPKPNWVAATNIYGSKFDRKSPLASIWPKTYCVVAHHSNVCCDALLEGIPVFAKYGAASILGPHDLSQIQKPSDGEGREQWAYNLAYSQWTISEMENGSCWSHLKQSKLLG